MVNLPKFKTSARIVSGSGNCTRDMPDSLHVNGRIKPSVMWSYLEKLKAANVVRIVIKTR